MISIKDLLDKRPWMGWLIFVGTMTVVFALGLLAANIMEHRTEALMAYHPPQTVGEFEPRNEIWGKNFPKEYSSYLKTSETDFQSKYNSSKKTDALEKDPKLVILWAGYAFSKEYNQPRGHYYAIEDIRNILRTGAPKNENDGPQPNTCWTCKSPDVPRVMHEIGIDKFYSGKWAARGSDIVNPIGCADCHDPQSMNLKITRPALIEAFQRQGRDIATATHQEKRSLVCAQCHVEYYFKGDGRYLTFPWDKGFKVEDIEAYYDSVQFTDWTHQLSKAPMLKAQHPEYETWQMGIHARRGVSCADCHMPYISEGGVKYTDHHVQSPLANINRSCQVCHRQSEEELKNSVYANQDRIYELRMSAEEKLVRAHYEAKAAWDSGATDSEMAPALQLIRHAQWRWDFSVASHGASAHAPVEMGRILGTSIDKAQEARVVLSRILAQHGVTKEVEVPDITTKAKAQALLGINEADLRKEKEQFLNTVVPQWEETARRRQSSWDEK